MKKIFFILLVLVHCAGMYAQEEQLEAAKLPLAPIVENEDGYLCNGVVMDEIQLINYLTENCTAAYNEFDKYANAYYNNTIAASVLTGVSIIPLGVGAFYFKNSDPLIGGLMMGLCGTLIVASIPCWVIAANKRNEALPRALDVYHSQCGNSASATNIQFNLNLSTNGLGVTMCF